MMDEREMMAVFAAAALAELDKMEKRRIKVSSPRQVLEQLFKGMRDPQPVEEEVTQVTTVPLPVTPRDFPRLLVSYGQGKNEYAVVNSYAEWSPLHHWFVIWPPQQAASRPVTTTLEAEIERLKAEGMTERPSEEHERRRQTKGYTE